MSLMWSRVVVEVPEGQDPIVFVPPAKGAKAGQGIIIKKGSNFTVMTPATVEGLKFAVGQQCGGHMPINVQYWKAHPEYLAKCQGCKNFVGIHSFYTFFMEPTRAINAINLCMRNLVLLLDVA